MGSIPIVRSKHSRDARTRAHGAEFRDHHRYSPENARNIEDAAAKAGARALVTTEKDAQNFGEARFGMPVYLAVISLEIPDEEAFLSLVKSKLPAPYGEAA